MTAYEANRSTTQTLTGTAADQVTLTQRWGAVRITNLHPSNFLWVSPDSDVAVAEAAGTIPVPPNSSRVIDVAHVTNARTMILGIVGNGNQYTVEGMFGSQAEVLSALADEVAEGVNTATSFNGARVYLATTAQSIPNATLTPIQFNAEDFDSNALHDNATNNTRLTIPAGYAGKWAVLGFIQYAANATGRRQVYIMKNGASAAYYSVPTYTGGGSTVVFVDTVLTLAVADYLELNAYHEAGAALNAEPGTAVTWFTAYYLGA